MAARRAQDKLMRGRWRDRRPRPFRRKSMETGTRKTKWKLSSRHNFPFRAFSRSGEKRRRRSIYRAFHVLYYSFLSSSLRSSILHATPSVYQAFLCAIRCSLFQKLSCTLDSRLRLFHPFTLRIVPPHADPGPRPRTLPPRPSDAASGQGVQ